MTTEATSRSRGVAGRLVFLVPGAVALLAGLDAALILLGVSAPVTLDRLADVHGMLMVFGFVGTLVALERAVALGDSWGFIAPGGFGAGGLALIVVDRTAVGGVLIAVGAAALIAVYVPLWRRNTATAVVVQAAGAVLALGAAVLYVADVPVPWLLPWMAGFLVLTIAGERLELARVAFVVGHAESGALSVFTAFFVAVPATLLWPAVGYRVFGAVLLALAMWLMKYDVARRTVRSTGLARFSAVCLLAGYAWLVVAGAVWLCVGAVRDGVWYDASAHAVFLGFVMSMIFAHAPVILPAVLRRPLPYRPVMYLPVAVLHATLALRIGVGDVADRAWAVTAGGVGNVVAVLLFAAVAAWSVVRA